MSDADSESLIRACVAPKIYEWAYDEAITRFNLQRWLELPDPLPEERIVVRRPQRGEEETP